MHSTHLVLYEAMAPVVLRASLAALMSSCVVFLAAFPSPFFAPLLAAAGAGVVLAEMGGELMSSSVEAVVGETGSASTSAALAATAGSESWLSSNTKLIR